MNEDAKGYLSRLRKCGWFERLPPAVTEALTSQVDAAARRCDPLWSGLSTVHVDSAYLLSGRPWEALLRQFADATQGVLRIDEVRHEGHVVRFQAGGRHYDIPVPEHPDEPPPALYSAVNRALAEHGSPLQFVQLKDLGHPIPAFALADPEALAKAVAVKLVMAQALPTQARASNSSSAELRRQALGTDTYTLTVKGTDVARIQLPGGFYEMDPQDDPQTGVVHRELFYEFTGTVVVHWGEVLPVTKLVAGKPKGVAERTIPAGTITSGKGRQPFSILTARSAPLQVVVDMPEDLMPLFEEALPTLELLAPRDPARPVRRVRTGGNAPRRPN